MCHGCEIWNTVTEKVCDGACIAWNTVKRRVCDGACLVWNHTTKTKFTDIISDVDCAEKQMKSLIKNFKCLKYLPKCATVPFCYAGKASNGIISCKNGIIAPSETCLRENGFL